MQGSVFMTHRAFVLKIYGFEFIFRIPSETILSSLQRALDARTRTRAISQVVHDFVAETKQTKQKGSCSQEITRDLPD